LAADDITPAGGQTLVRALDILDCLARENAWLSVPEISELVGLKRTTTYRLVKILASRGYLVSNAQRKFHLGGAVVRLSAVVMERNRGFVQLAAPALERLRDRVGETVSLQTIAAGERICVLEFVSREPIRMESGVGKLYPLYRGAAGKALLAFQPGAFDALVEDVKKGRPLRGFGSNAEIDLDALGAELDVIRARGYATSDSEVIAGAAALSVPVIDGAGMVRGAVNVTGPSNRWTPQRQLEELATIQNEVRNSVERLLGTV
jgi:IclR family transcriptional regulator, KDG regulon repressor